MSERSTSTLSLPGKLSLLGALYLAQGLPFGFFMQTLPAVMRKQGYKLSSISFAALLTLPWALKFLWAPLVDRYPAPSPTVSARRTRWIVACQLLGGLAFAALAFRGSLEHLRTLFIGFAVLNLISATQDIATDGLAVDMLDGKERGYANGIQVAGYRAGMVLGGGLLLLVVDRIGARAAFGLLGVFTVALAIPLFFVQEAAPITSVTAAPHAPALAHFLARPGVHRMLLVVVTYKLAESLAAGVLRPFLVDRGFSLAQIGAVSGIGGSTGGLLGALIGGVLASRLGRKPALVAAGIFQTSTVFLFAVAATISLSQEQLGGIFFLEAFASSMATATLFTSMMDWSHPLVGATDYTVQASAVVIATGLATLGSGLIAERVGYFQHFALSGLVGVGSIFVLLAAYPRERGY